MQTRALSIIPFGGPGSGKSNILNKLIGKLDYFKSSKTTESGETKKISSFQGPAFNLEGKPLLRIFDAPGVGDYNIPL